MSFNSKTTSKEMASTAAKILQDPNASKIQKEFAGSVLSQANPSHQTGAELESKASDALQSDKYNDVTKSLAASALSQSNKSR